MTWFRHGVTTNTRLDIEREHQTACDSHNPKKELGFSRTAHRRYALRNRLRSRLRQKLVECNDEIASPVRAVLRGRPFSRRALCAPRGAATEDRPYRFASEVFVTSH